MDFFIVLSDGETYSQLHGCKIVAVEYDKFEDSNDLDSAIKDEHADVITITTFSEAGIVP